MDTESVLRSLITDFGNSPLANGRRMRELIQHNAEDFRRSAVTILKGESDRRGCRYLLTLLWTHDLLLPILSDARLPLDRALVAAQVAAEIDPQLHIRITRYLIETTLEQQTIDENEATKLLQILGSINDSVSLQPFVRRMLLHPSPRIRSKLSLLIGRSQSGNRSLGTLLSDSDARVRANAVEALWHNGNPQICAMVRLALDDTNNRVVGNAILGLYFAGDPFSISAAIKLTAHPEPLFRATAAWAMGETGDPRFLSCLGRMLADSVGQPRKAVFRAIGLIKKASSVRNTAPPLRVGVLDVANLSNGTTRIKAVVLSGNPSQSIEIPPTGFVIEVAGTPLVNYSCSTRSTERVHLAFAVPRSVGLSDDDCLLVEDAVKSCLQAKRGSDQWAIVKYSVDQPARSGATTLFGQTLDAGSSDAGDSFGVSYTANPIALKRAAESRLSRFEQDPGLLRSLRGLVAATPPGNGQKHLVAVVPYPDLFEEEALDELIQVAKASRLSIHVICFGHAPEYLQLCHETQGFYREAAGFKAVQVELEAICAGLTKMFLLDFVYPGEVETLSLEAHVPSATGKGYWRRLDFLEETGCLEVA